MLVWLLWDREGDVHCWSPCSTPEWVLSVLGPCRDCARWLISLQKPYLSKLTPNPFGLVS